MVSHELAQLFYSKARSLVSRQSVFLQSGAPRLELTVTLTWCQRSRCVWHAMGGTA